MNRRHVGLSQLDSSHHSSRLFDLVVPALLFDLQSIRNFR